jgi:hypothetical protein
LAPSPHPKKERPNDAQMSLDYHLVDPLGDDEKDEQQSDVLDGCSSGDFRLKSCRKRAISCQQLIANPSNQGMTSNATMMPK